MIQSKITDFFYKETSTNKYNIKKNNDKLVKYNIVTNNKKMQNLVFGLSDKISKLQIEIYNNYNNNIH